MDNDALNQMMRAIVPLYEQMDIQVGVDGDRFFCEVPFAAPLKGHVGTVHAAFQWAAGELLGGVVVLHTFGDISDIFLVVRKVSIEFVAPAKRALVAETRFDDAAREKLRRDLGSGEVTLVLPVTVMDDSGTVVAKMEGEYLLRPRRKSS